MRFALAAEQTRVQAQGVGPGHRQARDTHHEDEEVGDVEVANATCDLGGAREPAVFECPVVGKK